MKSRLIKISICLLLVILLFTGCSKINNNKLANNSWNRLGYYENDDSVIYIAKFEEVPKELYVLFGHGESLFQGYLIIQDDKLVGDLYEDVESEEDGESALIYPTDVGLAIEFRNEVYYFGNSVE